MRIGANFDNGCEFTVWAPLLKKVAVEVTSAAGAATHLPMTKDERGYWHVSAPDLPAGTQYLYQLEGSGAWPDPASSFQPEGVHGPSEVVDHASLAGKMTAGRASR